MASETWIEARSHYMAQGEVDVYGSMTDAEVTDNNGFTRNRGMSFSSREDFVRWAVREAGVG